MTISYKIRHKASGLFYKPAGDTKGINVSKKGKLYQQRPSQTACRRLQVRLGFGTVGRSWFLGAVQDGGKEILFNFDPKDWEVVEYTAVGRENVVDW
jgi:hypothetical protein